MFGSKDKSWSFFDFKTQKCLSQVQSEKQIHSIQFHPDGLMLATGHQDRSLSIWDIRTQTVFTSITNDDVKGDELVHLCFSNKGYQFAAAWKNSNVVKLYDMRKNFTAVSMEIPKQTADSDISSLSFDAYGNYLMATQDN